MARKRTRELMSLFDLSLLWNREEAFLADGHKKKTRPWQSRRAFKGLVAARNIEPSTPGMLQRRLQAQRPFAATVYVFASWGIRYMYCTCTAELWGQYLWISLQCSVAWPLL